MSVFEKFGTSAAVLTLAAALAVTPVPAEDSKELSASNANTTTSKSVQDEATAKVDEKRKTLIEDATSALEKTEEALTALGDGDKKTALEALAIATGKLQSVVARDPELSLAPVDVKVVQRDLMGDIKTIETTREKIKELIDDGRFQEARPLMRGFASEVVVETTHLPLATYPTALLQAIAEIDQGKTEQAKQTLEIALSTIAVIEDTIALPILRAESLIKAAKDAPDANSASSSAAGETKEASTDTATGDEVAETKPVAANKYVSAARKQLELAQALGYGGADEFKQLYQDLQQLDEKIAAEQDTGSIFDDIGDSFSMLRKSLFNEKS